MFNNRGQSISGRFRVDSDGNFVEGWFDGDFQDVFQTRRTLAEGVGSKRMRGDH